jgi:hypothetical protein
MNWRPWKINGTDTVRPSLMYNGFLALGCLVLGIALFRAEAAKVEGAVFMGIFLLFSAAVIMAAHLPGCTGIWLDKDGFLARDMYKSERYEWSQVGPFMLRRRMLGSGVEFPYRPSEDADPQARHLPRGMGGSSWKLVQFMNERRNQALADEN